MGLGNLDRDALNRALKIESIYKNRNIDIL